MKRAIQLALGLGISAVCIWLSMKDVRLAEVWSVLKGADYLGFVAVMAVTLLGFYLRAIRWRFFIQVPRRLPADSLFSATMIGFMANNVLPFRLGEFVRPWALSRKESLSKTMLLATVVVERAIDMLTLLAIFALAGMLHPIAETTEAGRLVQGGARILLVACVVLTVVVITAERNRTFAQSLMAFMQRLLPERIGRRLPPLMDRFLDGFALFRDFGKLAQVFVLSFAMFLCFATALSVSMWSLRIEVPLHAGLVMLVVTAIGIMVPAAPGYVGTLNYACIVGLALFGVEKSHSAPFGWFYFFSQWLPITAVGLFYLNREGLSLQSLGQAQEESA
jgi:hypothetical protein